MRNWKRRLWVTTVGFGACLLILLGVLVGLFRIGMQVVPGYRGDVERQVAALLDSPVQIADIDLVWRGLYPTLQLDDVVVGDAASGQLELERLDLGFAVWRLVRGDFMPSRVGLDGTRLTLTLENGAIRPAGLSEGGSQRPPEEFLDRLLAIGAIEMRDVRITWVDLDHDLPVREWRLERLSANRQRDGLRVELDLSALDQPGSRILAELGLEDSPWRFRQLQARIEGLEPWPDLRAWLPELPKIDGELRQLTISSDWRDGEWLGAQFAFDGRNLRPAGEPAALPVWQAEVQLQPDGDGLNAVIDNRRLEGPAGPWPENVITLGLRPDGSGGWRIALDAQYLRLEDLTPWAIWLPETPAGQWRALAPRGELHDLVLRWPGGDQWPELAARLEGVGWQGIQGWPGLEQLSGSLSLSGEGGRLQLGSRELVLTAPELFDEALQIQQLSGDVSWQRGADGWQIEAPSLHYSAMSLEGVGRVAAQTGPAPHLDLDLDFFSAEPRRWLAYAPRFWPAPLREWLGRAVEAAEVTSGQLRIQGPLADFPFRDGGGEFRLDLALENLALKFAPDWPALEAPRLALAIHADRLTAEAEQGRFGPLTVGRVSADLPDLRTAELGVNARVRGDAADIWRVLGASKLRRRMRGALDSIDIAGNAEVDLQLDLPLMDLEQTSYRAVATLDRAALWTRYWPQPVKRIEGQLVITADGLRGRDISARLGDLPLTLQLLPQGEGITRLEAATRLEPAAVVDQFPIPPWLARRGTGESDWRLEMLLGQPVPELQIESGLQGTALDLPEPFGKAADAHRKLVLRIQPGNDTRLHVNYAGMLGFDGLLAADGGLQAARLNLGADTAPAGAPGWWIEGELPRASLGAWLPLIQDLITATPQGPSKGMAFGGLVLRIGELFAIGQRFPDTRLQLTERDQVWRLNIAGDRAVGELRFPQTAGEPRWKILGTFDRLNWALSAAADEVAESTIVDPRELPGIDLAVSNFLLNGRPLGRLTLDTLPISRGLRIRELRVGSATEPQLDLSGLWLRDEQGSSAALEFAMNTPAFRDWLSALGYQGSLDARRARLDAQLEWQPDPRGLKARRLGGHLDFEFNDGQLLNVEPGAGRMLGLFSINALPRRFFLDFRDVVDTGLGFDRLSGRFRIEEGIARTDNLEVKGTSLRVAARGAVDLAAREYDQTITIYPGVSSGVTLAATVLGGPAVGLFTLFAQELLDKPLDQVTQISYRLGGSWDNPEVTRLE